MALQSTPTPSLSLSLSLSLSPSLSFALAHSPSPSPSPSLSLCAGGGLQVVPRRLPTALLRAIRRASTASASSVVPHTQHLAAFSVKSPCPAHSPHLGPGTEVSTPSTLGRKRAHPIGESKQTDTELKIEIGVNHEPQILDPAPFGFRNRKLLLLFIPWFGIEVGVLRFGVWGLGFWVWVLGLGFWVWGLGFRSWGLGFQFSGLWVGVSVLRFWAWILGFSRVEGFRFRAKYILGLRVWG